MAKNDFFVVDSQHPGANTRKYDVDAGTDAITAGEWVIKDSTAGYVKLAADGTDTDDTIVGVAATDSTQTASADGVVYVYDDPDLVIRGKATTPGNLAQAVKLTSCTLDVSSGVQTIDENDTTKGAFTILNYNADDGTVDVKVKSSTHLYN